MIPDRIIEQDTLRTDGHRTSVEVRIPWYRAIPASCISNVVLSVDDVQAPRDSLRWEMNGKTYRLDELADHDDEWWFVTDSAVVSADLPIARDRVHDVAVRLELYIPYIITDHGVLLIDETDVKQMEAVRG